VRHRCHDELDTLFHESVGFAEITILTVKIDDFFLIKFPKINIQIQLENQGKDNWTANY